MAKVTDDFGVVVVVKLGECGCSCDCGSVGGQDKGLLPIGGVDVWGRDEGMFEVLESI